MENEKKEVWYGVFDLLEEKLLYLYKDQVSAINQARRGTSAWVIVKVDCNFSPLKHAAINCHCFPQKTI